MSYFKVDLLIVLCVSSYSSFSFAPRAYKNNFFDKNLKSIYVRLGSVHTTRDGETIPVQNVYFHPGYEPKHLVNNLAIIGLEKRIRFSRQQKRIRRVFWDKTPENLSNDTKSVIILGWGDTKVEYYATFCYLICLSAFRLHFFYYS